MRLVTTHTKLLIHWIYIWTCIYFLLFSIFHKHLLALSVWWCPPSNNTRVCVIKVCSNHLLRMQSAYNSNSLASVLGFDGVTSSKVRSFKMTNKCTIDLAYIYVCIQKHKQTPMHLMPQTNVDGILRNQCNRCCHKTPQTSAIPRSIKLQK